MASSGGTKEVKIDLSGKGKSRSLQLFHHQGSRDHVVLFAPGFMGCSQGKKAQYLKGYCSTRDLDLVLYDPEGLGESRVQDFSLVQFQDWMEDCEASLEYCCRTCPGKKILLIGSSMGGNIALQLAASEKQREKIWKLLLVAPSLNTAGSRIEDYAGKEFSEAQKRDWEAGKSVSLDTIAGKMPFRKSMVEGMKKASLADVECLQITCPVKILHGYQDDTVPYQGSLRLLDKIQSGAVDLLLRKDADHSFSRPQDLEVLGLNLDDMMKTEI